MATSKELLADQAKGAEIRITIAGEPTGGLVEYSPRYKGDRSAWAYREGRHVYRYTAAKCGSVFPVIEETKEEEAVTEENTVTVKVTPEMIKALAMLRNNASNWNSLRQAADILDNAGVFAAIDEATGYDVGSECTCPADERAKSGTDNHYIECPAAPAPEPDSVVLKSYYEAQLRAVSRVDPAPVTECTCGPGVAAQFGHQPKCPVPRAVLAARAGYFANKENSRG